MNTKVLPYGVKPDKVYEIDPETRLPKKYWYSVRLVEGLISMVEEMDHKVPDWIPYDGVRYISMYSYEKDLNKTFDGRG